MNWLVDALIRWVKEEYLDQLIRTAKVQAAAVYLEGMRTARRILVLFCVVIFVAALIGAGFVMIPVALLLFMPWAPQTKAIVAVAVGGAYVLIPLAAILFSFSEKRWMALTGTRDTLKKLLD
jgi:hypothetical protein